MQFHRLLSAFALFAISQSSPIVEIHQRVPDALPPAPTPACPDYCAGTAFNASLTHQYICGDFRLGPVKLPTRFSLSGLFSTYDRFGGLCPGAFLAKWTSPSTGLYVYPPDNGFQLDTAGQPIMGTVTLPVGLLIDRFGSENGTFVSPEGAPYMQRALPPVNLDTAVNGPRFPYNYHVYNTSKPFNATSGPIAAWFGQPGQGVQYELNSRIVDLLAGGYLVPMDLSKC